MGYRSMLDNFFSTQRPLFSMSSRVWNPPTDIYETETATIVKIEVAGLDEAQIRLTVQQNMLVVSGVRARPAPAGGRVNYHLMEVHHGRFERVFSFSFNLREQDIQASYDKGFLSVEVKHPADSPTTVHVEVIEEPPPKG